MKTGIYVITCIRNNKKYIGQSIDIEKRNKEELCNMKNGKFHNGRRNFNRHIISAVKKYGIHNFIFSIIELCNESELNEKEKYWIKYYNTNNPEYGYNLNIGGDGNRGYKHTDKTKKKMSKAQKNRFSKLENRMQASERTKSFFSNEENRNKSSVKHNGKPFFSINFRTGEIIKWYNQTLCSQKLNINRESVGQCLRNKIKKTCDFLFCYERDDPNKKLEEFWIKNSFIALNIKTKKEIVFFSHAECARVLNIEHQYIERCLNGDKNKCSSKGYRFYHIDKEEIKNYIFIER